ncbi:hypothetical protein FGRMN_3524 [Fusarium graminum]|nr:hypothetical protein FGRMN_3524 [Fusarium graminum]
MASENDDASTKGPMPQANTSEITAEQQKQSLDEQLVNSEDALPPTTMKEETATEDADEPGYIDTDDEDDRYGLVENPFKPRKTTEKKLRDNAVLKEWIEKSQREAAMNVATSSEPDRQSLAQLIHISESRRIIATPREYQLELFERAKEKNIIVVLPTGSGKTLISALLLRHHLEQEVEARSLGNPKKVAFFLVEKVALCVQQHAVLSCNLGDHSVAKFMGDTTGIEKNKTYWDTQFSENMVIVCTAQILLDCLNNGFINMSQINLLVLDEAHHAKKEHPYARIMRLHYYGYTGERPRILGMTASPVDSRTVDVRTTCFELERALDCEIATVSDEVLQQSMARQKQVEEIVGYRTLDLPEDTKTPLWDSIREQISRNELFKASLDFTKEASSVLGPWCADRYWQLSITEIAADRLENRTSDRFFGYSTVAISDRATKAIRRVREIVENHQFETIEPGSNKLSSKVKSLHEILLHAFTVDDTKRCIVFVEKRSTAFLLSDLYDQPSITIPGMIASYMVGGQSGSSIIGNMSFRDQVLTLQKFKRGDINCLFATQVAEEGIDVPDCDLIIRFDLYKSVIQYVQSKGRARQAQSRYITMLEEGNMRQLRTLKQATGDAMALQKLCQALPADRKLQDDSFDEMLEIQNELMQQQIYEIPSTGARLTFASSLEILARFASTFESDDKADYHVQKVGNRFQADVSLPLSSPVNFETGRPQRNKLLAKCSAAFEACKKLIKGKYIDNNLQPVFKKKVHRMRNARLAISSNKKSEYNMRLRPDIWNERGAWKEFFVTRITLDNASALAENLTESSIILLSRKQLPKLPDIPLYFGNRRTSIVHLTSSQSPLRLTPEQADGLARFTMRVFADVFSKEYDATCDQFPYLLAPFSDESSDLAETRSHIDWDTVDLVKNNETLEWENAPEEFFMDKLVTDPYDGGRKLITKGVDKSKKPSDPTPEGVPESRSRAYRSVEPTIKEYSNSLYFKSRLRAQWREDQPVVKAEFLPLRRNLLDEFQVDEEASKKCFVILEPLRVSPLPMGVIYVALTFPAIIHRIDSTLITLDACDLLGLSISPTLALEAMTKDSDNTDEHGKQQVNFQAGMGNNYERLEFLGDCFLKMASTISIYTNQPKGDECQYHVERMILITNQTLFNNAVDCNLQEYIRSKSFDRRTWYPDLPLKKGKAPKTTVQHNLADKTIADVCEALIGAAYLMSRDDNMNLAVKAVTRMVKSKNHKMNTFADYFALYNAPAWQMVDARDKQRKLAQKVVDVTGYTFSHPSLIQSAFRNSSDLQGGVPTYQRLEFLGDSLLDMVIVDYLYHNFPEADPQWLTEHKMAMVSNQFLGYLCFKLGLYKNLETTINLQVYNPSGYVFEIEVAEEDARKKAEKEGVPMHMDFWIELNPPPKRYADMIEALIGAMFVDSDYNFSVVKNFFTKFIKPYFEDMSLYDKFANKHPVTCLAKKMQQELGCVNWRVSSEAVPCKAERGMYALKDNDVVAVFMVHQKVITSDTSNSGRYAKVNAAKLGLKVLEQFGDDFAAAKKFLGCDCDRGKEDVVKIDHGTAI